MNLSELLNEITTYQKDSETLQQIINVTGSKKENILEDIKALQKNEIPTNINQIQRDIDRISEYIEDAEREYSDVYSDCESAISNLENVAYDLDNISDARKMLDDLRTTIEQAVNKQETEDDGIADGLEMDSETNEQKSSNYTQQ